MEQLDVQKDSMENHSDSKNEKTSNIKEFIKHFRRNLLGMIGLFVVLFLVVLVVLAPIEREFADGYGDMNNMLQPLSSEYWIGTDSLGLSIFDQVMWGAIVSLYLGIVSGVISLLIGVPIGLLSGYYGGKVSTIGMGLTDIFLTLPILPLMIIMRSEEHTS